MVVELPIFVVKKRYIVADSKKTRQSTFRPLQTLIKRRLPVGRLNGLPEKEVAKITGAFYLLHDLGYRGWTGRVWVNGGSHVVLSLKNPQGIPSKESIRRAMEPRRLELIRESADWIKWAEPKVMRVLVDGAAIDPFQIEPELEIVETTEQRRIFRYCRYLSSVPYSEYVGRRMHFLIRDASLASRPVIGLAAIGSSLLQISSRDEWIGWHSASLRDTKKKRVGNLMDLYVAVSLPPYSYLLGGKLVCYMMASNWVREVFKEKYENRRTLTKKRIIKDLVMLVTTSVYGSHSSQYNRVRYDGKLLFIPVGKTEGFGTLHIGANSFTSLRDALELEETTHSYKFGDGANWRLRVIRDGMNLLGFDAEECLNHGHPRGVFVVPLARNAREFLRGETDEIDYYDFPLEDMIEHWRERWLKMRLRNTEINIMKRVCDFQANSLRLSKLLVD